MYDNLTCALVRNEIYLKHV